MKFALNGTEMWIEFSYTTMNSHRAVTCRIFEPRDRDDRQAYFKRGWSCCAAGDVFQKERGRIVALTRAVKELPKDARRVVWAAYFGRKAAK